MSEDKKGADKKGESFVMSNPNTGEVRHITAQDWKDNEAAYLASGFIKPEQMPDK